MKKWIVCLVIGLALLAFGSGVGINDDTIRCGSEIMGPGDVCEETRAGTVTDTETYEEMKESKEAAQRTFNSWGRWALLGGGLALTGLGIWGIVKVRRGREEPYLGPGYTPGQAAPRQPGQPVGQYLQGMTPQGPLVHQQQNYGPPQSTFAPQQQNHGPHQPTFAPQQQSYGPRQQNYGPQEPTVAPSPQQNYGPPPHPNYGPPRPQQHQYPQHQYPQHQYPQHQYPQQPFGPGSQ